MTLPLLLGALFGAFLAYANGANDNFKGVATLFGSKTTSYKTALVWAMVTTLAGSFMALLISKGLIAAFSGKGLVPDAVLAIPSFSLAVALAAAITVMLATRFGFPISTTHALMGALVGAGWFASPVGINLAKLGTGFFLPLLLSPLVAIAVAMTLAPLLGGSRGLWARARSTCVCVDVPAAVIASPSMASAATVTTDGAMPRFTVLPADQCNLHAAISPSRGVTLEAVLNGMHFLSAGLVGFARGLNDTPKIAALLLAGGAISPMFGTGSVAAFMALGGIFAARKVAIVVSQKVTRMDPGQGLAANLATGALVLVASKFGLPVSTTHVSVGSLFGIGAANGKGNFHTINSILIAWVTTLPVAAVLGGVSYLSLHYFLE